MSTILIIIGVVLGLAAVVLAGPLVGAYIQSRRGRVSQEVYRERWDKPTAETSLEAIDTEDTQRWLLLGEHYFWKDPLGSHSLPIEIDQATPLAMEVFDRLAAEARLTGVGADVDAEWHDWDLAFQQMEKEELIPA